MKRQKKFTSESQIISAIDAKIVRANQLLCSIEHCDLRKRELAKLIAEANEEQANQLRVQLDCVADQMRKQGKTHFNIINTALPKLKRTLAAFRTQPMPFCDDSVVLSK